jgi:hypothetical protein
VIVFDARLAAGNDEGVKSFDELADPVSSPAMTRSSLCG